MAAKETETTVQAETTVLIDVDTGRPLNSRFPVQMKRVTVGDNVNLLCTASGGDHHAESPEMEWIFGGKYLHEPQNRPLRQSLNVTTDTNRMLSKLHISNASTMHHGHFECGVKRSSEKFQYSKLILNVDPVYDVEDVRSKGFLPCKPPNDELYCQHGGTCLFDPRGNHTLCICTVGHHGDRCGYAIVKTLPTSSKFHPAHTTATATLGFVAIVLCIMSAVMFGFWWRERKRNRKQIKSGASNGAVVYDSSENDRSVLLREIDYPSQKCPNCACTFTLPDGMFPFAAAATRQQQQQPSEQNEVRSASAPQLRAGAVSRRGAAEFDPCCEQCVAQLRETNFNGTTCALLMDKLGCPQMRLFGVSESRHSVSTPPSPRSIKAPNNAAVAARQHSCQSQDTKLANRVVDVLVTS